jgi:hypothetical protein
MSARQLRPQRNRLLHEIDLALENGCRRIMAQAPTDLGKTIVAATVARRIQSAGERAIFTVPALSLIDQTAEKFYTEGVREVGVNHPMTNYSRPIQIASVQTLQRWEIPPADLVMIDEAHRWFEFYDEWLKDPQWADVPFIGLTATPWTRGLGRYFDRLLIGARTQELIDAGHLSRFKVFAPASPDLSGVRTVAGEKCPKCTFLKPPKVLACPCCGFIPEPECKIESRDGRLVEMVSRYQAKVTASQPTGPNPQEFYRELKWIAQERGYQRGWVAHKFKTKFGHWPNGYDHLEPMPPKTATRSWVKFQQTAYAKAAKGAARL